MNARRLIASAALTIMALSAVVPVAGAAPTTLTLNAQVVSQTCQGGNSVQVVLASNVSSSSTPTVGWDTNGDRRIDAKGETITIVVPDETTKTVTAMARNAEGQSARDSLTFTTPRCGG